MLRFIDRGSPRPFVPIEELTAELGSVERAAYEKVIRMMSHEVHNTSAAVISQLESTRRHVHRSELPERKDLATALDVVPGRTRRLDTLIRRLAEVAPAASAPGTLPAARASGRTGAVATPRDRGAAH